MGEPAEGYPWKWSVYRWLDGETATSAPIKDLSDFAATLAQFLVALHKIDSTGGPKPGSHNFYRGGSLASYDAQTQQAITLMKDRLDSQTISMLWNRALATTWPHPPVWVHGDISANNLLVQKGALCAVIDFGQLGIGDPACDLAVAWTFFKNESREAFRTTLALDVDTWERGQAWALWKALIVAANLTDTNTHEASMSWHIIHEILADYKNEIDK